MTSAVITPESRSSLIELGNGRWRKQILPLGSISYKGQKISFDRKYFAQLVKAFKQQACGPVPFQLADAQNTHTNDPERRRGTVVDLETAPDGLYAILELDDDGEKLVKKYPDIGVSARIYENFERADEKFFPAALQHVLGTLDPHVPGMKPWQAVALSNDVSGPVIDLSDSEFLNGEEEKVATKATLKDILAKLRENGDEAELTDEELDQLLAITDAVSPRADRTESTPPKDESELTDDELDKLIAQAEADAASENEDPDAEDDEEDTETEGGDVTSTDARLIAATRKHQQALELSNQRIEKQALELAAIRQRLATQQFESEVRTLAEQYGIPPRITELARPLLETLEGDRGPVIQLANGDEVDAGAVMRKVLVELGSTIKALDLTSLIGNSETEPNEAEQEEREQAAASTREFVQRARDSYSF